MRGRYGWRGVILVAMVVLAGCGASTGGKLGSGTGGATPTATSQTTPTPSPTSSSGSSGGATMQSLGWTKASLKSPDVIAAAPSDPNTLYSCAGSFTATFIAFSVSHDGGVTWQTTNTPAQAGRCESLAVSPTSAQAVAFFATTCRADCGQTSFLLYSSLDGGAHWTAPALPSGARLGDMLPYAWVGTTLFAAVGNPAPHVLAASKNGGPFTWVNTSFAPRPFAAVGSTLYTYAATDSSACPKDSSECLEIAKTSDLGASWSRILPLYQGYNVRALDVLPDGVTMIGQETRAATNPDVYPLLRSTDGGTTWQALPDFPQGTGSNDSTAIFATPDGAAFVRLPLAPGATPCTIYKLTPAASAWACLAQTTGGFGFALVTWDVQGHPARVWGLVEAGYEITDLWSHPA